MIYTPIRYNTVTMWYHAALLQLARWPGLEFRFNQAPWDLIRCRSRGIRMFLDDKRFDNLILLDSDIAPNPRTVIKMLEMPFPIVGARYRLKKDPAVYVPPLDPLQTPDEHGTIATDYLPMGLVRITRSAVQQMWDEYSKPEHGLMFMDVVDGKKFDTCALFMMTFEVIGEGASPERFGAPKGARVLLSEDYAFCKRARNLGIPIRMMVEPVPHAGPTMFT
jgi:hypothetical protein